MRQLDDSSRGGDAECRLRLINVSLPKTGTTSVAGLFRRYRSAHEFMFQQTAAAIHDHRRGRLDDAGLRRFVLARAAAGRLEVDSASFNHWYAGILAEAFPDARFLLLFREPRAWVESVLGQFWREYLTAGVEERPFPAWVRQIGELMAGSFEPSLFRSREALRPALPQLVESLLRHWRQTHHGLLQVVPRERRLLIETAKFSDSLARLADFATVPLAQLDRSAAHLYRREADGPLLSDLDPAWLADAIGRECAATWDILRKST
jgi:hypothetical protein